METKIIPSPNPTTLNRTLSGSSWYAKRTSFFSSFPVPFMEFEQSANSKTSKVESFSSPSSNSGKKVNIQAYMPTYGDKRNKV